MADPWTEAWEEAEASLPPQVVVYPTIELRHPSFTDPVAVRFVSGAPDDMQFRLEAGAVLDGGDMVTFYAVPFSAERPEFAEGRMPECAITIDNVNREVVPAIEEAVKVRADLVVVYREYRSDDVEAPCFGPVEFKMRRVRMTGTTLTGTATLDNLGNRKFPGLIYSVNDFPGLT
jgi:hypothetical protein